MISLKSSLLTRVLLFVSFFFSFACDTSAQPYPNRSVRIIVPAPPGGGTDYLGREIGQKLSEKLGQSFIVENVPGATGNIGASQLARSAPDGYTLMMSYVGNQAINPTMFKSLNYDPADLIGISKIASYPYVIISSPTLPVKSLKELVQYAKSKPNLLNYGSSGIGSGGHLVGELFNSLEQTTMTHVPYKGSLPIMTDLMAGNLQLSFDTLNTAGALIKAGKLNAIAVTSPARLKDFPDVRTAKEQGFTDMTISGWYGLFGRTGTPTAIIDKLNLEIGVILSSPEMKQKLAAAGYEDETYLSATQYAEFVQAEIKRWGALVRLTGATAD